MKTIEEDTKPGKTSCAYGLKEFILLNCPYYPKLFTNYCKISHQNTNGILHRNNSKIHGSPKGPA
jgi:hypothetical protein